MSFISDRNFLAPVLKHLRLHMKDSGWTSSVAIVEVGNCLLIAQDGTPQDTHPPEEPRFVIAYFDLKYHRPLDTLPVLLLPTGIIVWESDTHNLRDVISSLENEMTHCDGSLRYNNRFFGSISDLEPYEHV
jgi:hypothetical protein